jgi:hypothetical protein
MEVSQALFLSGGFRKESSSKLIHVVGRVQFLVPQKLSRDSAWWPFLGGHWLGASPLLMPNAFLLTLPSCRKVGSDASTLTDFPFSLLHFSS